MERAVLIEFGRCLEQIINSSESGTVQLLLLLYYYYYYGFSANQAHRETVTGKV